MIDFAESKDRIYIFIYSTEIDENDIFLSSSRTIEVRKDEKLIREIDLYKDVLEIIRAQKHGKRLEVELKKKDNIRWYNINGPNRNNRKDGDKIKKFKEVKEEEHEDAFKMISRIYANGDDDIRRAMEKSFIESQGTVLSTDWSDVKNKKIEPNLSNEKKNNKN